MKDPQRRFTEHFKTGKPLTLKDDHPAVVEGRTLFPTRVFEVDGNVLKPGVYQRKLGSHVTKGRWAGMPIYSLTLEERATCPRSCVHWENCYGNHAPFSKRYQPGEDLEMQLACEIAFLNAKHPDGFVVRLHILGDFYSTEYVDKWRRWMSMYSTLHVFGYTARWFRKGKKRSIAMAIHEARLEHPERWWIRFSNRDRAGWLTTGESGVICPVQTGKTDCCGTCGLCWTAKAPIRFLVH